MWQDHCPQYLCTVNTGGNVGLWTRLVLIYSCSMLPTSAGVVLCYRFHFALFQNYFVAITMKTFTYLMLHTGMYTRTHMYAQLIHNHGMEHLHTAHAHITCTHHLHTSPAHITCTSHAHVHITCTSHANMHSTFKQMQVSSVMFMCRWMLDSYSTHHL